MLSGSQATILALRYSVAIVPAEKVSHSAHPLPIHTIGVHRRQLKQQRSPSRLLSLSPSRLVVTRPVRPVRPTRVKAGCPRDPLRFLLARPAHGESAVATATVAASSPRSASIATESAAAATEVPPIVSAVAATVAVAAIASASVVVALDLVEAVVCRLGGGGLWMIS
jgi:hypothetical protein